MEDEDLICCISCMSRNELFDLFAEDSENENNYGKVFETCFGIKIDENLKKYICKKCIETLEIAATFKKQTQNTLSIMNSIKDEEEYLDENILEEENRGDDADWTLESEDLDDKQGIRTPDETRCIFCGLQLPSAEDARAHMRAAHSGETLCNADDPEDNQCQNIKTELESRKYACHFCENVYSSRKACFTHLRMKHGLKCIVDQTKKNVERKKCPMCTRDFSQKQVLNKHLWKTHGLEVEKRKAFICPLCDERVSYGSNFSAHLLHTHKVCEQVEQLEFYTMDDFLLFKSAIQEETKYRFRKTTASKQTIEGIRSHYMCSQSGVYVYQGKGKRSAPDRQIYKTGKACPAHMIVTETLDRVLVTFYKTHVGHGPCPYYEPREPKKPKRENLVENEVSEEGSEDCQAWICDACGLQFSNGTQFNIHVASHGLNRFPCQYCGEDFRDMEAWTDHVQAQHSQNAANCYQYSNYIVM